jgi:DHA2 family multidrug resistance protein-like MFS transporter
MRQVGATIGVAVLGTILNNVYQSHLTGAGLPTALTNAAKNGVEAGVAVAQKVHSTALLTVTRDSFVHGLDVMLWVCGGIALASALLAVVFLPRRTRRDKTSPADTTLVVTDESPAQRAELGL